MHLGTHLGHSITALPQRHPGACELVPHGCNVRAVRFSLGLQACGLVLRVSEGSGGLAPLPIHLDQLLLRLYQLLLPMPQLLHAMCMLYICSAPVIHQTCKRPSRLNQSAPQKMAG